MTRQLDEACARVLGLTIRDVEWLQTHKVYEAPSGTHWTDDAIDRLSGGASIPAFSTNFAASHLLEDAIERRRLGDTYVCELMQQVIPDSAKWAITDNHKMGGYIDRASLFALVRATPEQRARAFIASTQ